MGSARRLSSLEQFHFQYTLTTHIHTAHNSHCAEEKTVFIGRVAGNKIVQVEYPHTKRSEVGTQTEVCDHAH